MQQQWSVTRLPLVFYADRPQPETILSEPGDTLGTNAPAPVETTLVNSAAGAAGALAGWAVSSLGKRVRVILSFNIDFNSLSVLSLPLQTCKVQSGAQEWIDRALYRPQRTVI